MDKEKDIEEMIEVLKNKHFEKKPHEYIADMPRSICSALVEAGYRKADEVRKETAKEILLYLKATITDGLLKNHEILNALMKKYDIEVDE